MAIGRAVVYYARSAQPFSAGIKCRHCISKFPFFQDRVSKALLFPLPLAIQSRLSLRSVEIETIAINGGAFNIKSFVINPGFKEPASNLRRS